MVACKVTCSSSNKRGVDNSWSWYRDCNGKQYLVKFCFNTLNLHRTVMLILAVIDPLREAVQVYEPASDGLIILSVSTLYSIPPLVLGDVSGFPQSNIGEPVTSLGREIEQLSSTLFPAMTVTEGREVMEIFAGSVDKIDYYKLPCKGIRAYLK